MDKEKRSRPGMNEWLSQFGGMVAPQTPDEYAADWCSRIREFETDIRQYGSTRTVEACDILLTGTTDREELRRAQVLLLEGTMRDLRKYGSVIVDAAVLEYLKQVIGHEVMEEPHDGEAWRG